jgi:hypothetical protein
MLVLVLLVLVLVLLLQGTTTTWHRRSWAVARHMPGLVAPFPLLVSNRLASTQQLVVCAAHSSLVAVACLCVAQGAVWMQHPAA